MRLFEYALNFAWIHSARGFRIDEARPNPGVVAWLAEVDEDRTFLSIITFSEPSYGIERMAQAGRSQQLGVWLEQELSERFEGDSRD